MAKLATNITSWSHCVFRLRCRLADLSKSADVSKMFHFDVADSSVLNGLERGHRRRCGHSLVDYRFHLRMRDLPENERVDCHC
jgi:hypothetical protein